MKRNHEYNYFDKVIEYEYDDFAFLTNVIEYEYDSSKSGYDYTRVKFLSTITPSLDVKLLFNVASYQMLQMINRLQSAADRS